MFWTPTQRSYHRNKARDKSATVSRRRRAERKQAAAFQMKMKRMIDEMNKRPYVEQNPLAVTVNAFLKNVENQLNERFSCPPSIVPIPLPKDELATLRARYAPFPMIVS